MGLFSGKCPPRGPKWSPNGARMVARTWFLRFSWNLVSVQQYIVFARCSAFSRPRPAPGTSFFVVLLRPQKKHVVVSFFVICASLWVPVRGGITHCFVLFCIFSVFCKTWKLANRPIRPSKIGCPRGSFLIFGFW